MNGFIQCRLCEGLVCWGTCSRHTCDLSGIKSTHTKWNGGEKKSHYCIRNNHENSILIQTRIPIENYVHWQRSNSSLVACKVGVRNQMGHNDNNSIIKCVDKESSKFFEILMPHPPRKLTYILFLQPDASCFFSF